MKLPPGTSSCIDTRQIYLLSHALSLWLDTESQLVGLQVASDSENIVVNNIVTRCYISSMVRVPASISCAHSLWTCIWKFNWSVANTIIAIWFNQCARADTPWVQLKAKWPWLGYRIQNLTTKRRVVSECFQISFSHLLPVWSFESYRSSVPYRKFDFGVNW